MATETLSTPVPVIWVMMSRPVGPLVGRQCGRSHGGLTQCAHVSRLLPPTG